KPGQESQPEPLREACRWGRNFPTAAALFAAIGVKEQRTNHADVRRSVEHLGQSRQCARLKTAVRIEKQHRGRLGGANARVAAGSEAEIIRVAYQPYIFVLLRRSGSRRCRRPMRC